MVAKGRGARHVTAARSGRAEREPRAGQQVAPPSAAIAVQLAPAAPLVVGVPPEPVVPPETCCGGGPLARHEEEGRGDSLGTSWRMDARVACAAPRRVAAN